MAKPFDATQLTLPFSPNTYSFLEDFCWEGNAILEREIYQFLERNNKFVFLWGACGKTHLTQGLCQKLQDEAIYLPLEELALYSPELLDGLENYKLIAIDNLQAIIGKPAWQTKLFHLFNKIRDSQKHLLIITANIAPHLLNLELPDLKSRMSWGLTLQIKELNADTKVQVLQNYALKKGFVLESAVSNFLITRCSRDIHKLLEIINLLDKASLEQKRKITVPFTKKVIDF